MTKYNKIEEKYVACMLVHALGDTIGFKNAEWEFNYTTDKIFEFIKLGGSNHLSLDGWRVSDDTMLHLQIAATLLSDYNSLNTFGENLTSNFLDALKMFKHEGYYKRQPGRTTLIELVAMKDGRKWNEMKYSYLAGGSGASMRSLCIGLAYYKPEDLHTLIQMSIESSRATHNSVIGYLGGFTSALFASYAFQGIKVEEWPYKLMELHENNTITKYIRKADRDVDDYYKDHHIYFNKWANYIQDKFDKNKKPVSNRSTINLNWRNKYYLDNFSYVEKNSGTDMPKQHYQPEYFPGAGGAGSVIMAYDALLDAGDKWETLIFYAMLHVGDTDTTGCIAGGWYGILYGMSDIPDITLKHLEYKKELTKLGLDLYHKFYKD